MKICPYCGKKYEDDVEVCFIDANPLKDDSPQATSTLEKAEETPSAKPVWLKFPDYKWSARDAWLGILLLVVFGFLSSVFISALEWRFPGFHRWNFTGYGWVFRSLVHYSIALTVAAYFARTETLVAFGRAFGIDRKASEYAWYGIFLALVIRFLGHLMLTQGWAKGVETHDLHAFYNTSGPEKYLFIVPLILFAPLFEEAVNRGFLYKAFRASYSLKTSVFLIVGWTAFTHWSQYSHSVLAACELSALTCVQCWLREKSDSLWDCIYCHLAFNGSLLFLGNHYA